MIGTCNSSEGETHTRKCIILTFEVIILIHFNINIISAVICHILDINFTFEEVRW